MTMKGISPLIAAVMLIFITMIIAGIMATWSTSLFRAQTSELECVGDLSVDYPDFDPVSHVVNVKIKNTDSKVELTGIRVYLEYSNASKNIDYLASEHGVADPLTPASVDWFQVDTGDSTVPVSIEVMALSCPKGSVSVNF
jgi:flagellin-like protein